MFGTIGLPELLLILVIVLIIFGAGKLPQLGRGIGEGIRNFRTALKGNDEPKSGGSKGDEGSKQG
ncbi:MAG TPA: twin-arginine translocase TatA/TatE family subunit [Thermoanaerobaculaceae bacterium]|nr:twin-arginine translocase TatA/TatE family subunit [Thermoanaerobaculaceae bacterium]